MQRVSVIDVRQVVVVCLLVALGAACTGTADEAEKTSGGESGRGATASETDSRFGPCDDVKLEEFQEIFGDRFTAVKVGGTPADCTIVARNTNVGESLTIQDEGRTGYGENFSAARSAAERDSVCPGSVNDVDGIGDRAFYVSTCASSALPKESLHIEQGDSHLTYSAYFVPADHIGSTKEELVALAQRLAG